MALRLSLLLVVLPLVLSLATLGLAETLEEAKAAYLAAKAKVLDAKGDVKAAKAALKAAKEALKKARKSEGKDDPHFTGAHGTHFDFNGDLDKSFCLISDKSLHVNALLSGYLDDNTAGAKTLRGGKAIHSWIKEVGLMWKDASGKTHKMQLAARKGKEESRGENGFMESITVDGVAQTIPKKLGEVVVSDSGMKLELVQMFKKGPYDIDTYSVKIDGILDAEFSMRAAHRLLRRPDDAEVHFNLKFQEIKATSAIHGVLGQTYREDEDRENRYLKYQQLSELLGGPVAADGETGKGFLDGTVADYETSSVMEPDCKFAQAWTA